MGETQFKNNDGIVRLSGLTLKKNTEIDILKILPCSFTPYVKSGNESWKAQVDSHLPLTAEACVIPQTNPCGICDTGARLPIWLLQLYLVTNISSVFHAQCSIHLPSMLQYVGT